MWDLVVQLLPEMVGLVVTPAAVVACFVLLGSPHPVRDVVLFTTTFLTVYAGLSAAVLAAGRSASGDDVAGARGTGSVVVGVLFLALAALSGWRGAHRPREEGPPAWVARLADPAPGLVVAAALVLAVVNPNVAILLSGLGVVLDADVTEGQQVVGGALLLAACAVDFVAPTAAYLLAGERGRGRLRAVTAWLLRHQQAIGLVVLVFFGLLFVARGLSALG